MGINKSKIFTALIAGGGTGGHLFPALAIGDGLQKIGYDVKYIGSVYGLESKIFPRLNKKHYLLDIKGLHRTFSLKNIFSNILFPYKFLKAYSQSNKIIKKINPHIVIGTGGYASGIPLLVSINMKIKTLIHEQNSYPGLTTRKLSNRVDKVCITNQEAKKYLNGNIIETGIPIRENLKKINKNEACKKLGLSINKKTIFIVGGSQGSEFLNKYFENTLDFYLRHNIQIIWQCGSKNIDYYREKINSNNILLKGFFNQIDFAYSASDIIISRAGAMALNEIAFMEKPMILIPLENSAGNHQLHNAMNFYKKNAAVVIEQNDLKNNILEKTIDKLFQNENKMIKMAKNANQIIIKNARDKIIDEIKKLNTGNKNFQC